MNKKQVLAILSIVAAIAAALAGLVEQWPEAPAGAPEPAAASASDAGP